MYRGVARQPGGEFHFELGRGPAERLGYPADWLAAVRSDTYLEAIEAAGLRIQAVRPNHAYRFLLPRARAAAEKYGVTSVSVLATAGEA